MAHQCLRCVQYRWWPPLTRQILRRWTSSSCDPRTVRGLAVMVAQPRLCNVSVYWWPPALSRQPWPTCGSRHSLSPSNLRHTAWNLAAPLEDICCPGKTLWLPESIPGLHGHLPGRTLEHTQLGPNLLGRNPTPPVLGRMFKYRTTQSPHVLIKA